MIYVHSNYTVGCTVKRLLGNVVCGQSDAAKFRDIGVRGLGDVWMEGSVSGDRFRDLIQTLLRAANGQAEISRGCRCMGGSAVGDLAEGTDRIVRNNLTVRDADPLSCSQVSVGGGDPVQGEFDLFVHSTCHDAVVSIKGIGVIGSNAVGVRRSNPLSGRNCVQKVAGFGSGGKSSSW